MRSSPLSPQLRRLLTGSVLAAALIRLALILLPGHAGDTRYFVNWAARLVANPASTLYDPGKYTPDHLPPDVLIHWMFSHGYRAVTSRPFTDPAYLLPLKVFPTLVDALLAAVVFLLLRRWAGSRRAVLGASLVLLAPPLLLTSSLWGQWDSLPLLLMGVAALGALRWPRLWGIPFTLAVYALFIKPPLAVIAAPFVLIPLAVCLAERRGADARRILVNAALGSALGLAAVAVVSWFFRVTLWPAANSHFLLDLVRTAADKFRFRTLNAPNLWGFLQHPKERVCDDSPALFGLTADRWGHFLFLAFIAAVIGLAVRAHRRGQLSGAPETGRGAAETVQPLPSVWVWSLWTAACLTWGSVFFLTRAHERYLLPSVVVTLLLALVSSTRLTWSAFAAVTVASTLCTVGALLDDRQMALPYPLWLIACAANLLCGALLLAVQRPGRGSLSSKGPRRALAWWHAH